MSLRTAAAILKDYAQKTADSNNSPERATNVALHNLADGLFDEFASLHQRLDAIEASLQRLENPDSPSRASG